MTMDIEYACHDSLLDILEYRVKEMGGSPAYTFVNSNETVGDSVSFRELLDRVVNTAQKLKRLGVKEGDMLLLAYPPGIEFVSTLLGCMYVGALGGAIAYPKGRDAIKNIISVANKVKAKLLLTSDENKGELENLIDSTTSLAVCSLGEVPAEESMALVVRSHIKDAYIQLTSGSTGLSKALVVDNASLLYNSKMIKTNMESTAETTFVSWLPHYHDLGLVVNILQSLYCGGHCVLLSPATVISNPTSWLRAITKYKAQVTSAPNFAYQLCVDRVKDEEIKDLDLSSLNCVINASEPVSADTLREFIGRFAACGFESQMFLPSYGMAEATVFVSSGRLADKPVISTVDLDELTRGNIIFVEENGIDIVGCGKTCLEQEISIFNPETLAQLGPDRVGEIWVSGENVLRGYIGDDQATENAFCTHLGKSYLRTGDLGFQTADGELYITGRIKDVVIVRGANYYPHDIEHAFESAHPYIRKGFIAAFNARENNGSLTIVAALDRHGLKGLKRDENLGDEICLVGREAVLRQLGLRIEQVLLVNPREVPITTSGKICRQKCKHMHADEMFDTLYQSKATDINKERKAMNTTQDKMLANLLIKGEAYFKVFSKISKIINDLFEIDVTTISPEMTLFSYGVDSIKMIELHATLEREFGVNISVVDIFDAPSFIDIVDNVAMTVNGDRKDRKEVVLDEEVAKYVIKYRAMLADLGDKFGGNHKAVFLTGGAGFYGGYLLSELLKQSDAKVVCLVRAANVEVGLEKLITRLDKYRVNIPKEHLARVEIVVGDITQDKFGLDDALYNRLAEEVSMAVHCAAIDNFYLPYSAVKRTNVDGSLEVVRFCLTGRLKSMQHISSCAAELFDAGAQDSEAFGLRNGYAQSKYVSEKVVVQLIESGMPGAAYRLGYLYCMGIEGVDDDDAFETLIHAMAEMKMVPNMDSVFDLTPVHYAAASVIHTAFNNYGEKPIHTYYNPVLLKWADIVSYFKKVEGMQVVDLDTFVDEYRKYLINTDKIGAKLLKSAVSTELNAQINRMFLDFKVDMPSDTNMTCEPCDQKFLNNYMNDVLGRTIEVEHSEDELVCD